MKIVAVINARMSSTRLPGKALLPLGGESALFHHVARLKSVKSVSEIWLATTKSGDNDVLIERARKLGVSYYRGEEEDIVERYISIGEKTGADVLVRCGCDKPLFSVDALEEMISNYEGEDYCFIDSDVPVGFKTELVKTQALVKTHDHYRGTAITQYIRENPQKFTTKTIGVDNIYVRPEYRIALDTEEDYEVLNIIFNELYMGEPISLKDVFKFLDDNPQVAKINRNAKVMPVNYYTDDLLKKPVMSIYQSDGKYFALDRMEREISTDEFRQFLRRILESSDAVES